jgi:hypothetical protein
MSENRDRKQLQKAFDGRCANTAGVENVREKLCGACSDAQPDQRRTPKKNQRLF